MSTPTISPRSSSLRQISIEENLKQMPVEEKFDPITRQIEILSELASSDSANPKQLQSVYQSTIMVCVSYKQDDKAIELLIKAETDQIFAGMVHETRAQFYSTVIYKLIENGSHAKAYELYKNATFSGVWNNPHHEKAKNALTEVGYTF